MRNSLTTFALIALIPAGAALASDDECFAPKNLWQSRDAALQQAQVNGWTVREFKIDDGCYKIEGSDSEGREIEAMLDPATLQPVKMEYEEDASRSSDRNPASAGNIAPPQNGLLGNGAPKVQVK